MLIVRKAHPGRTGPFVFVERRPVIFSRRMVTSGSALRPVSRCPVRFLVRFSMLPGLWCIRTRFVSLVTIGNIVPGGRAGDSIPVSAPVSCVVPACGNAGQQCKHDDNASRKRDDRRYRKTTNLPHST